MDVLTSQVTKGTAAQLACNSCSVSIILSSLGYVQVLKLALHLNPVL